jgi:hypothetical protein
MVTFLCFCSKVLWRAEYFLVRQHQVVDPQILPDVNRTALSQEVTSLGDDYVIVDSSASIVDYRDRFTVYLTREAPQSDLVKFKSAVMTLWKKGIIYIILLFTY